MMKGLLIKDLQLMKNQKMFFVSMTLVGVLFLITQEEPYFAISYIVIMFSMFTVTTFSYDEFDNGAVFLFTLPFSRKDYVKEKYLYGFLSCAFGLAIIVAVSIAIGMGKGGDVDLAVIFATALSSITISILFLSIAIPVEIKFGVEKGRIGFMLIFGIFFASYFVAISFAGNEGKLGFQHILSKIADLPTAAIFGAVVGLWIAAYSISMSVSMKLMERKEY